MRALGGQHHCTLWRSFRNVNGGRTVPKKLGQTLQVTLFGEQLYLWSKTDDYRDRSNLDEILKTYTYKKSNYFVKRRPMPYNKQNLSFRWANHECRILANF